MNLRGERRTVNGLNRNEFYKRSGKNVTRAGATTTKFTQREDASHSGGPEKWFEYLAFARDPLFVERRLDGVISEQIPFSSRNKFAWKNLIPFFLVSPPIVIRIFTSPNTSLRFSFRSMIYSLLVCLCCHGKIILMSLHGAFSVL